MEYIIDAEPEYKNVDKKIFLKINNKIKSGIVLTDLERRIFLAFYVDICREILEKYLHVDILKNPLLNRCDLAQHLMGKLLEKNKRIRVLPKETQDTFYPTCLGHSFLVCVIQDVPYLIDLTYRQFFLKENCTIKNFYIKDNQVLKTPDPGFFMINYIDGAEVAKSIIVDGYIELNADVAKKYGDSFYFTKTGYRDICQMPGSMYLRILLKENHQYAVDDERFYQMYGRVM